MKFQAAFFDLGGVIVRTEYQAPRQHLAERLGMEYEDLVRLVFESETSRKASLGAISEEAHWAAVARQLKRPQEVAAIRDEFFAGDVVDRALIDFIRSLRPRWKTGLISNAWLGLRGYIVGQKFEDAFDRMIISAEVGVVKPKAEIYRMALEQLGVKPDEALFVDDFIENIKGCEKIGMKGIHFKDAGTVIEQVKNLLQVT